MRKQFDFLFCAVLEHLCGMDTFSTMRFPKGDWFWAITRYSEIASGQPPKQNLRGRVGIVFYLGGRCFLYSTFLSPAHNVDIVSAIFFQVKTVFV